MTTTTDANVLENEQETLVEHNLENEQEILVEHNTPWEAMEEARKIVNRRSLYTAGIGLIPIPALDVALILGVQVWMTKDIAKAFNVEFKEQIARSLITTLVGNLAVVGGIKLIPGVGSLVGGFATALSAGAATYALGKVFTLHFNQGGTLLDFDPITSREYFQKAYEEGKLQAEDLREAEQESKKEGGTVKNLWNKWTKKSQTEAVEQPDVETEEAISTLHQTNEELKATIAKLQEELTALNKS